MHKILRPSVMTPHFVLMAIVVLTSNDAVSNEPRRLFDGESFRGWRGDLSGWEVVDGTLASLPGKYAAIYTSGEYADFELSFEFRLTSGANNGVALRAPGHGDPAYVAMESQILDNTSSKYQLLQPYQYHGSVYGVAAAERGRLKPIGEWNVQQITCDGPQIKVVLNGKTILDVDLRTAAPNGVTVDGKSHPGLARETGSIGFLGHGDRVTFRNVTVTHLD